MVDSENMHERDAQEANQTDNVEWLKTHAMRQMKRWPVNSSNSFGELVVCRSIDGYREILE
jgi:hypothetical protein